MKKTLIINNIKRKIAVIVVGPVDLLITSKNVHNIDNYIKK
jgi:hypothetical protein